jgi:endonuclease-3 related protein
MLLTPVKIYELLLDHFGSKDWWPVDKEYHKYNKSDPRFEVIIGAILTQNTAWGNVEKALINLKTNNILTIRKIVEIKLENLKIMIQPSGFFNQKAKRLKIITLHLHENYEGELEKFVKRDKQEIREEMLSMNGIGPETADSILLYAGDHPIFVIDAYTKRICKRLPIKIRGESYDETHQYF